VPEGRVRAVGSCKPVARWTISLTPILSRREGEELEGVGMNSPFEGTSFVLMWIGFLILMSSGIVIFFVWAIRNGQFADQDRARYLALMSGIPSEEEERKRRAEGDGGPQP
jgi:cbb3-type cytochrome oxidase maturation protein